MNKSTVERPGTGGQEPRRKWGGRCIGGRRRESGKQNSQGGWEKWEAGEKGGNYAILHNILLSKSAQIQEATKIGWEPGLQVPSPEQTSPQHPVQGLLSLRLYDVCSLTSLTSSMWGVVDKGVGLMMLLDDEII